MQGSADVSCILQHHLLFVCALSTAALLPLRPIVLVHWNLLRIIKVFFSDLSPGIGFLHGRSYDFFHSVHEILEIQP